MSRRRAYVLPSKEECADGGGEAEKKRNRFTGTNASLKNQGDTKFSGQNDGQTPARNLKEGKKNREPLITRKRTLTDETTMQNHLLSRKQRLTLKRTTWGELGRKSKRVRKSKA